MKKILISGVIIIAFAVYLWFQRGGSTEVGTTPTPSPTSTASASPSVSSTGTASPKASPTATATQASSIKSFTVNTSNLSFVPNQIKVKKGDTVKITFKNSNGQHDWRLDEFNTRTNVIGSGQEQTIQFVADKTGTFEYYCSVGNHRALGMKGNLIVE